MSVNLEAENSEYIARIASINHIDPSSVDPEDLDYHYAMSMDNMMDQHVVGRYVGMFATQYFAGPEDYRNQRQYTERMNQLAQLTEGLLDKDPYFLSYGYHIPNYLPALQALGQDRLRSHRALLVGAMTPNTVKEFTRMLEIAGSEVKPTIIDIEGVETEDASKGVAHFRAIDAVEMPFRGEFDSIHTHCLLEHLTSDLATDEAIERFFAGSLKALAPGGKLLMSEYSRGLVYTEEDMEFVEKVTKGLDKAGFDTISFSPSSRFQRRRYIDRFLDNPEIDITGLIEPDPYIHFFLASKSQ